MQAEGPAEGLRDEFLARGPCRNGNAGNGGQIFGVAVEQHAHWSVRRRIEGVRKGGRFGGGRGGRGIATTGPMEKVLIGAITRRAADGDAEEVDQKVICQHTALQRHGGQETVLTGLVECFSTIAGELNTALKVELRKSNLEFRALAVQIHKRSASRFFSC